MAPCRRNPPRSAALNNLSDLGILVPSDTGFPDAYPSDTPPPDTSLPDASPSEVPASEALAEARYTGEDI